MPILPKRILYQPFGYVYIFNIILCMHHINLQYIRQILNYVASRRKSSQTRIFKLNLSHSLSPAAISAEYETNLTLAPKKDDHFVVITRC